MIQRRGDFGDPRINFTTTWNEYKSGFGDLYAEFWFGNDFIHRITNEGPVVLRVELSDFDNVVVVAEYSTFRFGLPIAEAFHFQFGVIWAIVVAQGVGQLLNMV